MAAGPADHEGGLEETALPAKVRRYVWESFDDYSGILAKRAADYVLHDFFRGQRAALRVFPGD
jgi:hypothetical protein